MGPLPKISRAVAGRLLSGSSKLTQPCSPQLSQVVSCSLARSFPSCSNVSQWRSTRTLSQRNGVLQQCQRRELQTVVARPSEFFHRTNVRDNPGAKKKKKRVGRGEGSGKGKTSGRGHKGFKARQGRDRPLRGFQGGGTGILKAFPKFGFRARKKHSSRLYLDALQYWVQSGRLDASKPITLKDLVVSGCVRRLREEVVLLARGYTHFNIKVDIEVTRATRKSIEVIESQGGSVKAVFIDSLAAQAIMKPEKFAIPPLDPIPVKKDDIARYIDPSRRGYLSSVTTVEDGEQLVEKLLALTKPGSGDKVYRPAKSL